MLISITGSQTFSPGNWHKQFKVGLGLDLSSGTEVVLKAATAKGAPSSDAMAQAITVLESRVNGTGNSGAQVQQQGSDLINVTVPGKAAQDVINLVSSTAKLAFRPVYLQQYYTAPAATPTTSPSAKASGSATPTGSATSTATGAPTSSTGASASTSASPKASAQDYAAQLASPSATATAKASSTAKASATPTASSTAKASATPTPASTAA